MYVYVCISVANHSTLPPLPAGWLPSANGMQKSRYIQLPQRKRVSCVYFFVVCLLVVPPADARSCNKQLNAICATTDLSADCCMSQLIWIFVFVVLCFANLLIAGSIFHQKWQQSGLHGELCVLRHTPNRQRCQSASACRQASLETHMHTRQMRVCCTKKYAQRFNSCYSLEMTAYCLTAVWAEALEAREKCLHRFQFFFLFSTFSNCCAFSYALC